MADKADASVLDDYETTAHADETYQKKADASPIKTIAQQGRRIPVDEYGDARIGYTAVSHVVTSGQKDLLTISQIVTSAFSIPPSEKPTHFLQLFLDAAVDGVRKTGQIVFKSDNDSYEDVAIDIVSKQWVEEYIASLDANNTGY